MQFPRKTMRGLNDLPTSFSDAVAQWKTAVADFVNAYAEFQGNQAQAANDPDTQAAWNDLNSQAQTAQAGITDIAGKLQASGVAVSNFFDSAGNVVANAVERVFGLPSLKGFGVIPVVAIIGVAAIVGATAYLANVIANLIRFNGIMAQARATGATASQTAQLLDSAGIASTGFFGSGANLGMMLLLGGAVILFLPRLLKGKNA